MCIGSGRESEGALPVKQIFLVMLLTILVSSCGVKNDPKSPGNSDYPRNYPAKQ